MAFIQNHQEWISQLRRSRVAICTKNGLIPVIAFAATSEVNAVGTLDPRQQPPYKHKSFETPEAAEHWFEEYIIATVTENSWTLAYNGTRNFG